MENGKLRDTCLIKQNKQTEEQPITTDLRQAGFRTPFYAFCVYFGSVLCIKCSGKIPPERKSANRYPSYDVILSIAFLSDAISFLKSATSLAPARGVSFSSASLPIKKLAKVAVI